MKNSMFVRFLPLTMLMLAAAPAARLDVDHHPFLEDFRAAEGRVRLVTVLSPT